jgi:exopolysaccharide production protein ExoZ
MDRRADSRDIPFIHLLRGLAPLPILCVHLPNQEWSLFDAVMRSIAPFRISLGELGVAIFFLISGFVISHVAASETRSEVIVKRIARLWPTILVAIGLTWALRTVFGWFDVSPFAGFSTATTPSDWLKGVVLLDYVIPDNPRSNPRALGVMWTLVVEVLFYALAAALIGMMRIRPVKATAIMMALAAGISVAWTQSLAFQQLNFFTPVALYLLVGRVFYLHWRGLIPGGLAGAMGALSVGLCFGLLSTVPGSDFFHAPFTGPVTYLTAAALFLCAMQAGISSVSRPIRFLADVSYPVYMLHVPVGLSVMAIGRVIGLPVALSFTFAVAMTLAASWVTWRWIERPAQRVARRWFERLHLGPGESAFVRLRPPSRSRRGVSGSSS